METTHYPEIFILLLDFLNYCVRSLSLGLITRLTKVPITNWSTGETTEKYETSSRVAYDLSYVLLPVVSMNFEIEIETKQNLSVEICVPSAVLKGGQDTCIRIV